MWSVFILTTQCSSLRWHILFCRKNEKVFYCTIVWKWHQLGFALHLRFVSGGGWGIWLVLDLHVNQVHHKSVAEEIKIRQQQDTAGAEGAGSPHIQDGQLCWHFRGLQNWSVLYCPPAPTYVCFMCAGGFILHPIQGERRVLHSCLITDSRCRWLKAGALRKKKMKKRRASTWSLCSSSLGPLSPWLALFLQQSTARNKTYNFIRV